ncbi:MAG: multidrug ABC transporter permease [Thermoplasmata archaeon M8B2D]|nr:MAG: multidrug ABC transporter permease [Thermoplasmata archaeon M8B2D]
MKMLDLQAVYVMWLRQMKRFFRSKGRLATTIIQPLFFLLILGSGFRSIATGLGGDYLHFLAPGIITMAILFSSMFTGISVLWDKQFGFLQEVLVAPVSRISIIIGRTLGGTTTALIQGFIILIIAIGLGVPVSSIFGLFLTVILMILIAFSAVGFGLVLASKMQDFQAFPLIMNLIIMPLLFLSSAFFPVSQNQTMQTIAYVNPMFYMVDGLRGALIGSNNILPIYIDFIVVIAFCILMMGIGSYFFSKSEA